jgi:hypothetical protein
MAQTQTQFNFIRQRLHLDMDIGDPIDNAQDHKETLSGM